MDCLTREAMAAYTRHRAEIVGMLDERFHPHWWVEGRISAGEIDLLHNDTAIIGIEVRTYPGGAKELHGLFAAGDLHGIGELVDQALVLAAAAGCDIAAIESRAGWEKQFKNKGFRRDRVRIVRELR